MRITCQRIGRPPISTRAFGIAWVRSCRRVPRPPQRIATGVEPSTGDDCPSARAGASAAGDRRKDLNLVAVVELGFEPVLEADVLTADEDVDEPAQPSVLGDALTKAVVLLEDSVERLTDGRPLDLELALAAGRRSELGRDLDRDAHRPEIYRAPVAATSGASTFASKESSVGSISLMEKPSRTASRVFKPSPVIQTTTRSSGSMSPRSASLASTATVTPPAVSVKMPVVSASRRMPARISASETESIAPPVPRASSSAYGPSAGSPMARLFAIVSGRCGRQTSAPSPKAVATGEQPSGCAPLKIGTSPSTSPRSSQSRIPRPIRVKSEPEAI